MKNNEEVINNLYHLLCKYKQVDRGLLNYLDSAMPGKYYPHREILYPQNTIVSDAIFVSDGYMACYSVSRYGDRQLLSLYGKNSIVAGKSFMEQKPSRYKWVVLPDTYLVKVSYWHMQHVYKQFPEAQELARIIMAEMTEKEQERLRLLKRPAAQVIADFYTENPGMRKPGHLLSDVDIADYLLVGESTLRRERTKFLLNN